MPRNLKFILALIFVAAVAFFTARSLLHKKEAAPEPKHVVSKTPAKKKAIPALKPPAKRKKQAKMAIVLDDWGENYSLLDQAVQIGKPLTIAILPNLPYSSLIAEDAKKAGLGVMLHMPMQAKNKRAAVEPNTLLTSMPDSEIVRYLDAALAGIPGAEGVNNHQGSLATSDARVMRTVMTHLKKKKLFFMDSHVIATSVCSKVAKEVGIPFTKRDVFIDNVAVLDAIKGQLREAERVALRTGGAVVIGHDKKVTLRAIQEMVPELEEDGIKLVPVKELLK